MAEKGGGGGGGGGVVRLKLEVSLGSKLEFDLLMVACHNLVH